MNPDSCLVPPTRLQMLTTPYLRAYLNKRLVRACKNGDVYNVQGALQDGAAVNYWDKDGMTPLHWAVERDFYHIAACLLQVPDVQVDCLDRFQCTPLSVACEKSSLAMVDLLLRHGANVNHADTDGWSPLHWTRSTAVAHRLLSQPSVNINAVDQEGESALHLKVDDGDLQVAAYLLEKGANVNLANKDGWTPLQTATNNYDLQMTELLLRHGANLSYECPKGTSPLMSTCLAGMHYAPLDVMPDNDNSNDSNDMVVDDSDYRTNKKLAMARILLQGGADPTRLHSCGLSPIHYVCEKGRATDILHVMLEYCTTIDLCQVLTADNAETPLHSACRGGNVEMVKLLLQHDENGGGSASSSNSMMTAKARDGRTPWMMACEGNHVDLVRMLLQETDMLNQASSGAILQCACQYQCLDVVKMLCEEFQMQVDCCHDADHEHGGVGLSPLESACAHSRLDTIMYLLRDHVAFLHLGGTTLSSSSSTKMTIEE